MATRLIDVLPPAGSDPSDVLEAITEWASSGGRTLYPHQEEAILELFAGNHVVLGTPTGTGKSLVALAAHAISLNDKTRSWYTAPVKALVSEKFFELCGQLGPDNVGLLTGDSSINADAPVVCCTTEILALAALRDGASLDADIVVLDEFHYYGDNDRGWAWQIPILELANTRFVLMSATLGNTSFLREDLTRRSGRATALVDQATRPVPLNWEYRRTLLHHSVEGLLADGVTPIYLVNFAQADAVTMANALASIVKLSPESKAKVAEHLATVRMSSGFGKDLARLLRNGVGIHHAGMLPKYRRLVERLAQQGLLKLISGTDTLGVGVNLPIRTVLLTRLYKYDGTGSRIMSAREFHQIAGRAGRAGFDVDGLVVCQAPEHVAENETALAKAQSGGRKKPAHKSSPPQNYVPYDEDTFNKLRLATPEPLASSFRITPTIVMHLIDRPGPAEENFYRLLHDNHESPDRRQIHIERTQGLIDSLRAAGVIEDLDSPDELGRLVRIDRDLQTDFALNQPLAPFLVHAVSRLTQTPDGRVLTVLALTESVLDSPGPILVAQRKKARDEAMAAMKAAGVDYDTRLAELDKVSWPTPLKDDIYQAFDEWRLTNTWIETNIAPKGVVRDMWDRSLDFTDFVRHYGLKRSEGLLLRYLSDCYKTLLRTIPEDLKDDDTLDLIDWLEAMIRGVDSSLVDEWHALANPDPEIVTPLPTTETSIDDKKMAPEVLKRILRTRAFRVVQLAALRGWEALSEQLHDMGDPRWAAGKLAEVFEAYFAQHDAIITDSDARGPHMFSLRETESGWVFDQTLKDPEGFNEWFLRFEVDPNSGADTPTGQPPIRLCAPDRY